MDRLVAPGAVNDDEERLLTSLRPRTLDEFIGQDQQRKRLHIALEAARERREPLEHLLLSGPPGLGKTTLAHIVAHEMGGSLVTTSGPALDKTLDLMGMLTGLEEGDVFFIDEIHRMPRIIEEYLYPAMEDFKVDFVLDKGPYAKAFPLAVKPFTLVGATTRKGLLSSPLRERFGLNFELDFYTDAELTLIVRRSAGLLNVHLQAEAAEHVARRSRGTPRIANRLLRRVRDFAQVYQIDIVTSDVVAQALELEGVDALGLDDLDRRYLRTLMIQYEGRPTGVLALAASMQQEVDTLEEVVEPYLLHEGFLLRTPNGRLASAKAHAHLQLPQPGRGASMQQPLLLEDDR
ncbi:MAG TPA: Holliday junction branch migration DNA helicase RuvB [Chloroflexota bacterium]|jgi:Holliday junction DNA helicase RuvB|nr:Holliday junction branch migration DNA helicase RuvB [Chloroflexota bacterium]